jgi:hypothetical protein
MFCPKCGSANSDESLHCAKCGQVLKTVTPASSGGDPMTTIIPYKNEKALIAYYLGVFSLIPCLGSPLGITALILGLKGLNYAKEHPEAKGQVHAWIGIIVGGFFGLVYTLLIIILISTTITHTLR